MSLFAELKRRNVFRVGIAYVITAWLILQVADIVLDNIAAPGWLMQAIMLLLGIGFPLALLFAWAFELTPEGLKKEKDVDRSQSITHVTGRKLDFAIIGILAVALGYFAWDKFYAGPASDEQANAGIRTESVDGSSDAAGVQQKSLAVLPFVDMSPARDNEYFTDGLTEELLNILAQIKSLQVAGRTSSFAFKGKTDDLREIGNKLNVNTLLEGSVRKDDQNQRIRVTVQLINVADGFHIWSDTYDRNLEDIFAIQEDIARQVAEALKINLLGADENGIASHAGTQMSAYDLYLKGLQSLNVFSFESLREAERLLTDSLAIDPDYLPTKMALGRALLEQAQTGAIPAPDAFARAEPLLDAVLAEDPGNSDALSYKGYMQDYDNNFAAARELYEQAVEASPRNAIALTKYGRFLFRRNEVESGLAYLRQAARIEPYDVSVQWELCITQAMLIDTVAAQRECGRIGEIEPGNPAQHYGMSYLAFFRGDFAQALYSHNKAMQLDPADPELPAGAALWWIDLGDLGQADYWLQKAGSIEPEHPTVVAARIEVLLQKEQYQQALGLAQQAHDSDLPDRQGSEYTFNKLLVDDAVRRRDYDKALRILNDSLPAGLSSPLESDDPGDAPTLASMAMVLKLQDPVSETAPALLQRADNLNNASDGRVRPFQKPFNQALIESARGDKAAAISSLRESIDKGWRWDWHFVMNQDFRFAPLHQEPEFKNLVTLLEQDMEQQRERARELLGLPR